VVPTNSRANPLFAVAPLTHPLTVLVTSITTNCSKLELVTEIGPATDVPSVGAVFQVSVLSFQLLVTG
jgi:hypothetical protein